MAKVTLLRSEIVAARKRDESWQAIADSLGVGSNTVIRFYDSKKKSKTLTVRRKAKAKRKSPKLVTGSVTLRYDAIIKLRNKGLTIPEIAEKMKTSHSSISRCLAAEEDMTVRPYKPRSKKKDAGARAKAKRRTSRGNGMPDAVGLAKINRALGRGGEDALRLQGKITSVVKELRARGVSKLFIDLDEGSATLTYNQTQTIQIGGN